ncbi:MAG: FKBP-type peptidyl-prolyl cis-trans isomerase [archaeon]|nr:FKBP-type peptidyl-prolyl cis-trans isomerase [archaeon]
MFFGVVLQPGKVYSQTLEHDLVLAQVALGEGGKKGERSILQVDVEGHKFVVASLRLGETEQAQINLHFVAGTSLKFLNSSGSADLHVLGNYIIEETDDLEFDSEDSEDSEFGEEFGEEDDIDSDDNEDDGIDSDDDEEDDDSDEKDVFATRSKHGAAPTKDDRDSKRQRTVAETFKPSAKISTKAAESKPASKADAKTPVKAADAKTPVKADTKTPVKVDAKTPVKAADAKTPVKAAADAKTPVKAADAKPAAKTPTKGDELVRLPSGVAYQVIKSAPAAAPAAKKGKTVVVAYKGTLQQGGKQFDASDKFDFKLGAGDVIRGWDIGVEGMKIGEKRKISIPPALAYGKEGVNERGQWVIPRNAALDFVVELISIKH